jgi:hypothetical protein
MEEPVVDPSHLTDAASRTREDPWLIDRHTSGDADYEFKESRREWNK